MAKQFAYPKGLVKDDNVKGCKLQKAEINQNKIELVSPNENNIHGYKALENFAFIDILVPTYDFKSRYCNYYDIVSHD